MKKWYCLILVLVFSLAFIPTNIADEVEFIVSVNVPQATGISIVATKVDAASNEFLDEVDALNFDPLQYITEDDANIWLPPHFFAIDVGATGGAGAPNVTVSYTEGAKPDEQVKGLGSKTTATFVKIVGSDDDQTAIDLVAHGPTKLLKDLVGGEAIDDSEILGGFLRMFVGIFAGDNQDIINAGGEPFTNSDRHGDYDGKLKVAATL